MSDTIRVTPEHLTNAAREFHQAADDVLGLLGSLDAAAWNLKSEWSGRSGASFRNLWDQWHREIYDLANAMQSISTTLSQTASAYQQTDAHAIRSEPGLP